MRAFRSQQAAKEKKVRKVLLFLCFKYSVHWDLWEGKCGPLSRGETCCRVRTAQTHRNHVSTSGHYPLKGRLPQVQGKTSISTVGLHLKVLAPPLLLDTEFLFTLLMLQSRFIEHLVGKALPRSVHVALGCIPIALGPDSRFH